MAVRRIWLTNPRLDGKPIADFEGVADEAGESELWQPYGLSSGHAGQAAIIEVDNDADNHFCLPANGDRVATDATLLYWRDTLIELRDDKIRISVGGSFFEMSQGQIRTDMTIRTTGDVIAGNVSLRGHKHGLVRTGTDVSGTPV